MCWGWGKLQVNRSSAAMYIQAPVSKTQGLNEMGASTLLQKNAQGY